MASVGRCRAPSWEPWQMRAATWIRGSPRTTYKRHSCRMSTANGSTAPAHCWTDLRRQERAVERSFLVRERASNPHQTPVIGCEAPLDRCPAHRAAWRSERAPGLEHRFPLSSKGSEGRLWSGERIPGIESPSHDRRTASLEGPRPGTRACGRVGGWRPVDVRTTHDRKEVSFC